MVVTETPSLFLRLEDPGSEPLPKVESEGPRLLSRISGMEPEAMEDRGGSSSLFQRLDVPLEQRLGSAKPRQHRKHNCTQKRLKKEGEEFSQRMEAGAQTGEDDRSRRYAEERLRVLEQQRRHRRAAELKAREEEHLLQMALVGDARARPSRPTETQDFVPYDSDDHIQDEDLYGP
ncbi:hypothetical protein K438DRAFT_1995704 [Mycena galopus ATCC 62051]|nr:hypothetical protein K438DRAFT_1995704 [Mycena galopus ATCC 62051]